MEGNVLKKIVYEDEGVTKVLKGRILKEDEFLFVVEAERTNANITIGKRCIVKISEYGGRS